VLEDADGAASVLAVMSKSPADKAGIQPGDRLMLFNDTTVAGLGARALELRLAATRGPRFACGSSAARALEPDTFSVTLQRAYVKVSSVSIVRLVDPPRATCGSKSSAKKAASEVHDALKRLARPRRHPVHFGPPR